MLLMSDLRHAGVTPARAAELPRCSSPAFSMFSPRPFPRSLLLPCLPMLGPSKTEFLLWHGVGKQVSKSFFLGFFSAKCNSCSLVVLFSVYPLLDPLPLSLIPALHSCTKMSVMLQEQPPPGAWSGPEGTSLVPAPVLRSSLLATARTGWHGGRLEPTRTHHRGL